MYYLGRYASIDTYWRSSYLCYSAFLFLFMATIISPLSIVTISYARFNVVTSPFTTKFTDIHFVKNRLLMVSVISSTFAIGLYSFLIKEKQVMPSKSCFLFVDHSMGFTIFKFLCVCQSVYQILSSGIMIIYSVILLKFLKDMKLNKIELQSSISSQSDGPNSVQIIVMIISCIFCWLPSAAIYLCSIFLQRIPPNLITWTTILILPINSIVLPVLFIKSKVIDNNATNIIRNSETTREGQKNVYHNATHYQIEQCAGLFILADTYDTIEQGI